MKRNTLAKAYESSASEFDKLMVAETGRILKGAEWAVWGDMKRRFFEETIKAQHPGFVVKKDLALFLAEAASGSELLRVIMQKGLDDLQPAYFEVIAKAIRRVHALTRRKECPHRFRLTLLKILQAPSESLTAKQIADSMNYAGDSRQYRRLLKQAEVPHSKARVGRPMKKVSRSEKRMVLKALERIKNQDTEEPS